ncbi:MAG TPA: hypothetical protein EYG11_20125 [Candidatus Latescibacteria bacterium]|nr:hypothetical protein [Candidatus Handelsmanbacteria bacterium]HIL11011.1 hypothetical protein [Candidatus Latescibacterota bacterium]
MIVAIHQPQFMPWLGYFDKMDQADCFVLLDNVQYKKNEWQNRNRIKGPQGPQWLTVPVQFKFPALITEVGINGSDPWRRKQLQALKTNYAKAPYWPLYEGFIAQFYGREWGELAAVNKASVEWLRGALGIDTPLRIASEMKLNEEPTQRLIDICKAVGADAYLAGVDGKKYMDLDRFAAAGLRIVVQEYEHPTYPQLYGEFASHLSALDLLHNCGPESGEILRSGRKN